jgi:RNA polymerase sigma-70 factor (ECF subfamily)
MEIEYEGRACQVADQEEAEWQQEYERQLFHLACERVRAETADASWQAFWRTAVECQAAQDVGRSLRMSVGAVYTAKSRVLARLRAVVAELDEENR